MYSPSHFAGGIRCRLIPRVAFVFLAMAATILSAQSPNTGTVSGRIFNPATQEYVRNAEVRIEGTNLVAYSGDDGSYILTRVPAGEVRLAVTYTGYDRTTALVRVQGGQTAAHDFSLKGSTYQAGAKDQALVMDEFVVSSEREGNAKAIMEQRVAINFKNVVAADSFGDVTGGNIGEFIKYLPGVVMDYNNSDARSARIGGLDPRYVGVSVDGMNMASASGGSFGANTRAFEFEQASIYGTESIEIIKTTTASMDADAPAGRINMRSRSAFDRKGREITAQLTLTGNTAAISQIQFRDAPKLTTRASFNLSTDYKITPHLVFSLRTSGSHLNDGLNNREQHLTANPAQIDPASTLTHVVAHPTNNANTRLHLFTNRRDKLNTTVTYTPKLEYKRGDLNVTSGGGYSRSRTGTEDLVKGQLQGINRVTRLGWMAERSGLRELDWHITQLSGLAWDDPLSYNRHDKVANNVLSRTQSGRNQVWVGYLDVKKTFDLGLPIQLGAGIKTKLTTYDQEKTGNLQWTYVGPSGSQTDPTELALKWACAGEGITSSLCGSRNVASLQANLKAAAEPLEPAVVAELNQLTAPLLEALGPSFDYYESAANDRTI